MPSDRAIIEAFVATAFVCQQSSVYGMSGLVYARKAYIKTLAYHYGAVYGMPDGWLAGWSVGWFGGGTNKYIRIWIALCK